uniref:collagen alpha-5(VI) chain-like n=1 Tax=Styela clava TaxID=7725 RepID=UPI00193A3B4A|nr:collagen alpha-5(VI) chain-like [Styela clava]
MFELCMILTLFVITTSAQKECLHTSMDLMFVLDGSGSVGNTNWEHVKTWLKTFVSHIDLENVHVGVVQYSHWLSGRPSFEQRYVKTEIELGKIKDQTYFQNAVDTMEYQGFTTYTAHAINKTVNDDFMRSDRFNDSLVHKVMILLTDGKSLDYSYLPYSAAYAKSFGITTFSIGVGQYNKAELQIIANGEKGNDERVLILKNFADLSETVGSLQNSICEYVNVTGQNSCTHRCIDLMFVLDGSASVGQSNWNQAKLWVKMFVDKLDLEESVAVGVVQFSHWLSGASSQPYMKTEIPLGKYDNVTAFYRALDEIELFGYTTYTAHAINKTVNEDFMGSDCFDRPSVKKIMILLTDGMSSDGSKLSSAASYARSNLINIFAIGVGSAVPVGELQIMATGELDNMKQVYPANTFDSLKVLLKSLKVDINSDLSDLCSI